MIQLNGLENKNLKRLFNPLNKKQIIIFPYLCQNPWIITHIFKMLNLVPFINLSKFINFRSKNRVRL